MGVLSGFDRTLLTRLVTDGVMQDVNQSHLQGGRRFYLVVNCPDGDQFDDFFTFLKKCQGVTNGCQAKVHPISLHGGIALLPPGSPLNRLIPQSGDVLFAHIKLGHGVKSPDALILTIHFPCGMAEASGGVNALELIDLAFEGKMMLREVLPSQQIIVFAHVDWQDGRKYTYFLCRDLWSRWKEANSEYFSSASPSESSLTLS